jgi:membrane-associated phospholipid phosphatase
LSAEVLWGVVTRLGESGIVLPCVLVVAIGLAWSAKRADRALSLLLPVALAATLVTATKIAFMGFGWGIARIDFTGMSGHAMLAAALYPVLVVVFVPATGPRRAVATGLAAAVVVLVAVSRVALGTHSASEVLSGGAVGALAAAVAVRSIDRTGGARLSLFWLAPALVWLLLTLPAPPVMASHDWIAALATTLSGRERPYVRADLHR